jgi:hypothetical protein
MSDSAGLSLNTKIIQPSHLYGVRTHKYGIRDSFVLILWRTCDNNSFTQFAIHPDRREKTCTSGHWSALSLPWWVGEPISGALPIYFLRDRYFPTFICSLFNDAVSSTVYIHIHLFSVGHPWNVSFRFSFLILRQSVGLLGRGISPSQSRYLQRTTKTKNKRRHASIPWVAFEPTIPTFRRVKTIHAFDRAATVNNKL